jgi:hypothetical protein
MKNYDIDMFRIIETIFYLMCLDYSSKPTMEKKLLVIIKTLYEINGLIEIWHQIQKIITHCKVDGYSFMCLIHYER